MVRVLGVDLSGRATGRTGLALVEGETGRAPVATLVRSHEGRRVPKRPAVRRLAELAVDLQVDLVAIDAPLTLPHTWTCEDGDCDRCFPETGEDARYTLRETEEASHWSGALRAEVRPMPTAMIGALAVRGVYLRRAIEREGITTLETWPAGVLTQLAGDGTPKPSSSGDPGAYVDWARRRLDDHVELSRNSGKDPDDVDAVAAGLAGWIHASGRGCQHVGGADGICVPVAA